MTIQRFIKAAIEGGWERKHAWPAYQFDPYLQQILLDPASWKAVGKVEGWDEVEMQDRHRAVNGKSEAVNNMHRMIDALAEGKSIETFLETL